MNNSLAEVHPELITEWSEKNLPLTPDDITFGSNKKVWWKGTCGHEWQTSVKARSNGEKCPICSGARVIAGINDLATLEPLLAKQWSKKNKIKPTEVSIGSHKKVIWRCEKGHEWEAAVKSRTINKTGCPYCSHNKVLAGFNDLATLVHVLGQDFSIGSCLLVIIAGTMVGVMFSMIAIESGSVWNSGIVHAIWNVVIIGGGLAIGEKMDKYSIMTYVLNSKDFAITGGEFGIESSVISLFGYIIVAGIAFFMIKSRKN